MKSQCQMCKVVFDVEGVCPYCNQQLISVNRGKAYKMVIIVGVTIVIMIVCASYFRLNVEASKSYLKRFVHIEIYEVSMSPPAIKNENNAKPTLSLQACR